MSPAELDALLSRLMGPSLMDATARLLGATIVVALIVGILIRVI